MSNSVAQVRCPNCGSPNQASIQQLVDVGQEPTAKARLLSGALNRMRCTVCGFDGQLGIPLVYHDPEKELLLTFVPLQLGLAKEEQERLLGQLINQAINRLPRERRKAYLLQPQAVLTMQSMVERILQADGITPEEIEAERAKMRLLESLLRTPSEALGQFAAEHEAELDETFFQLATLTLQATPDENARNALGRKLEETLPLTSYGKRLQEEQEELRAASNALREVGPELTREKLLDLLISAPNEQRVIALTNLARPALDYPFFQMLSERIDGAQGSDQARLRSLRQRLLEIVEQIDDYQKARAAQASAVLKALVDAPDLDRALAQAMPAVDELFLGVLQASLRAARERSDQALASRLETISQKVAEMIRQSMPPGIQLAERVIGAADEKEAESLLAASPEAIDEDFLGSLIGHAQALEAEGDSTGSDRLRRLHRHALRISMQRKLQ